MKKSKLLISHRDSRGVIIDLLEKKTINAITYITIKKNKVRGNHIHKKTTQWIFILDGKIKLFTKKKNQKIKSITLKKNDLLETPPNEAHAFKAIRNSIFLVFTKGPRSGRDYEKDTFRLKEPLV